MPCNPFSLIILFSNPFNASDLGGGEGWGQQRKGSLGCGVGWHWQSSAAGCQSIPLLPSNGIPQGRHPTPRDSSQGSVGGENFHVGRTGVRGNEAGLGQTAEPLILQMLTDF